MSALSLATAAASLAACGFFAARVNLLKADNLRAAPAPLPARLAVFAQAAAFGWHAQMVFFTGESVGSELFLSCCGAIYAVVMWANLRLGGDWWSVFRKHPPGHPAS